VERRLPEGGREAGNFEERSTSLVKLSDGIYM
jgi:hypothetical protein